MSEADRLAKALEAGERSGMWYPSMEAAAELRRLSAELAALKALMGEPVGWCAPRPDVVDWRSEEPEVGTPLYTHPAPQARPQPLTSDQKWDMWTAATIEQPSARGCYFRGVEDAEYAHGITKE